MRRRTGSSPLAADRSPVLCRSRICSSGEKASNWGLRAWDCLTGLTDEPMYRFQVGQQGRTGRAGRARSSTINNDDCAESDKSGQPTELHGAICAVAAPIASHLLQPVHSRRLLWLE